MTKREKCEGVFIGLVTGWRHNNGGVWPAITKGECQVITYTPHSDIPAVIQLETDIIAMFIAGNRLQEKKTPTITWDDK